MAEPASLILVDENTEIASIKAYFANQPSPLNVLSLKDSGIKVPRRNKSALSRGYPEIYNETYCRAKVVWDLRPETLGDALVASVGMIISLNIDDKNNDFLVPTTVMCLLFPCGTRKYIEISGTYRVDVVSAIESFLDSQSKTKEPKNT